MSDFIKIDKYHMTNGKYSISKCHTEGIPKPYGLWRIVARNGSRDSVTVSELIGHFATAKEAMEAAQ